MKTTNKILNLKEFVSAKEIGRFEKPAFATKEDAKKIKQKITHIIKKDNIVMAKIQDGRVFIDEGKDEETRGYDTPLLVYSNDAVSPHYWKYLSNTGMLDFHGGVKSKFVGLARKENTIDGAKSVPVEYDVIVNDTEINAEMNGLSATTAYLVEEEVFYANLKAGTQPGIPLSYLHKLKPAYSSVSQTRKGDLVYIREEEDRLALLAKLNFDLMAYMKTTKDGRLAFDAIKAYSRTKLSNSSGKALNFLQGYALVGEEQKEYKGAPIT